MNIYIHKNDQQLGPFDQAQIAEGLSNGQFVTDDLAWHEGLTEWVQLGELLKTNEVKPPIPENTQVKKNIFDSIRKLRFVIFLGAVIAIVSFLFLSSGGEKTVKVEMFIRTKGGESIKLGLVDVKSYEINDCIEPLKDATQYRSSEVAKMTETKKENDKEYYEKSRELQIDSDKIEKVLTQKRDLEQELYKNNINARISFYDTIDQIDKKFEEISISKNKSEPQNWYSKWTYQDMFKVSDLREDNPEEIDLILSGKIWERTSEWKNFPEFKDSISKSFNSYLSNYQKYKNAQADRVKFETENDSRLREIWKTKKGLSMDNADLCKRHNDLLEIILKPDIFYHRLPAPYSSSQTNADGKCEFKLPANKKWIIAAKSERLAAGETEGYVWIVELPENFQSNDTLMLSNNNLLHSGITPMFLDKF